MKNVAIISCSVSSLSSDGVTLRSGGSFTELGKEILTIIDDVDINRKYLKDFCKSITENKNFLEVTCGDLIEVGDHYQFSRNENYFEIPEIGNDITLDTRIR